MTRLRPRLEELLFGRLDDDAVGVPHHGDQHVQQKDGDQDLYSQGTRSFILLWRSTSRHLDGVHSHAIIILHYIAISMFSSGMGIRICTHRGHDNLFCYDDQQVGTWMNCILPRSLYFIIESSRIWIRIGTLTGYTINYSVMMIINSAPGWDQKLHSHTIINHYTALYSDQQIQQQDGDQNLCSQGTRSFTIFWYDDQQVSTKIRNCTLTRSLYCII